MFLRILFCVLPVILCLTGCDRTAKLTRLKSGVTFEVHSILATASANTISMPAPDTGEEVFLFVNPLVTAADVVFATATTDEFDLVALNVIVNKAAGATLAAATAIPGSRLGVMVNGKLIFVSPVVTATISNSFAISGSFNIEDWNAILE